MLAAALSPTPGGLQFLDAVSRHLVLGLFALRLQHR